MSQETAGKPRMSARQVALEALLRIEDGAFANLVTPQLLHQSDLDERDRAFVTELVYGTTRRRRALDWVLDRHTSRPLDELDADVRNALRLGAYQLLFLKTPPHAAVGETVDLVPRRASGLVNAVLRKVAQTKDIRWPDPPTRLSYPDWIVARLAADLGPDVALAALEQMNEPATPTVRDDGYVQDRASQLVAEYVGARPGELVLDVAAAPGGKATAMAHTGAHVVAVDVNETRARLLAHNARRVGVDGNVHVVVADGMRPPFRPHAFDRVLVDAPCTGLGVLRRRPDARWRVEPHDVDALAAIQQQLLDAAIALVRPGGTLVYSVCTLTADETTGVDGWLRTSHPEVHAADPPAGAPWDPSGRGARILPQTAGTDGMFVLAGTLHPS
jgi:16S rRNA (cytosine967-C5)-methyltransferase